MVETEDFMLDNVINILINMSLIYDPEISFQIGDQRKFKIIRSIYFLFFSVTSSEALVDHALAFLYGKVEPLLCVITRILLKLFEKFSIYYKAWRLSSQNEWDTSFASSSHGSNSTIDLLFQSF